MGYTCAGMSCKEHVHVGVSFPVHIQTTMMASVPGTTLWFSQAKDGTESRDTTDKVYKCVVYLSLNVLIAQCNAFSLKGHPSKPTPQAVFTSDKLASRHNEVTRCNTETQVKKWGTQSPHEGWTSSRGMGTRARRSLMYMISTAV
eukprot:m.53345 g.53345  ORF g.53345 m.53345 type:complete len:145 (-) comp7448_c0_seq3:63-497(-)